MTRVIWHAWMKHDVVAGGADDDVKWKFYNLHYVLYLLDTAM